MTTKMKILLTKDVEHLGKAGDLKEVSGGYGRNYLIPKGFAVLATKGQVRQSDERLKAQSRRVEATRRDAEAQAARSKPVWRSIAARWTSKTRSSASVSIPSKCALQPASSPLSTLSLKAKLARCKYLSCRRRKSDTVTR